MYTTLPGVSKSVKVSSRMNVAPLHFSRTLPIKDTQVLSSTSACAFHDGTGIAQDFVQAAKYFQLAADQRHNGAQNNLANAFLHG